MQPIPGLAPDIDFCAMAKRMKSKEKGVREPSKLALLVADNVLRLMTQKYALHSNRHRALADAAGVSLSTIQRLVLSTPAPNEARLETIEHVAKVFDMEPFQLLIPWDMLVHERYPVPLTGVRGRAQPDLGRVPAPRFSAHDGITQRNTRTTKVRGRKSR